MAASNTVIITSATEWGEISKSSFPITITMTASSVGSPTLIRASLNYNIPMGETFGEEDEKAFTTIPFSGEGTYEMVIEYDMIKDSVLEGENYIYLSLGYDADIGYDRIDFTFVKESEIGLFVGDSDGTAKKAIDMFIGIDGMAKRVKEAFIGINGIAKKFYSVEIVEINILNELEGAEIIINGISYTKAQTIKTIKGTNITARIGETDLTENNIYFNGSSVINNVGGGEVEYTFKAEKSYKIDYSASSTKHYMHIDEINLINFTIEGVSYQAEEGMTWLDWINSKYNTDGYYQNGSVTNIVYAPQENYGFTVGYIDTELIEDGDAISLRDISNVSIEK